MVGSGDDFAGASGQHVFQANGDVEGSGYDVCTFQIVPTYGEYFNRAGMGRRDISNRCRIRRNDSEDRIHERPDQPSDKWPMAFFLDLRG